MTYLVTAVIRVDAQSLASAVQSVQRAVEDEALRRRNDEGGNFGQGPFLIEIRANELEKHRTKV